MITEQTKRKLSPVTGALDFQPAIEEYANELIQGFHAQLERTTDINEVRFVQGRIKQLRDLMALQQFVRGK